MYQLIYTQECFLNAKIKYPRWEKPDEMNINNMIYSEVTVFLSH